MRVVDDAAEGKEALRLTQRHSPDVALVEVSMPRCDGVTLAREMSRPSPKIIPVTRHDDGAFVTKMRPRLS